jgi:hypothetical protein
MISLVESEYRSISVEKEEVGSGEAKAVGGKVVSSRGAENLEVNNGNGLRV